MSTALKQTNEQTNKRTNKNNLGPLCPSLKASTRFQLPEKKKRKLIPRNRGLERHK